MEMEPLTVTESSRALRQIAARLVESCPAQIGQEVILFGSAGWGTADEQSDIDLDFWVAELPAYESVKNWLMGVGVTLSGLQIERTPEEGMHLIGRCQDTWVEFTWSTAAWKTKTLTAVLAGEVLERSGLAQAWNLSTGLTLRTHGLAGEWQQKLAHYPAALQARLVSSSTEFWLYPHHIEVLWTLAHRRELMGLDEWLFADLQDGLRILFAINRQWEPDWKNISAASKLLQHQPSHLIERVNRIFLSSIPEERVETTLRLLVDILSLVPQPLDVSAAKRNIESSLKDHCA